MIRIQRNPTEAQERRALRDVLGLPPSSGSSHGSTFFKRHATCPRAARLYAQGVRPIRPPNANLEIGDAFHLVLEAYYRALQAGATKLAATQAGWKVIDLLWKEPGFEKDVEQLGRSLTSYFEFAEHDDWQVIAVEEELSYFGLDFDYTARLDLVIVDRADGRMYCIEHKTSRVITANMTQGYLMDLQTLGQAWLMTNVVDLDQYPPFAGVKVNITSKQTMPKHERVFVPASPAYLAEFELSVAARTKMHAFAATLGYPKMFGNCTGAAQYFGTCSFFDLCYGHPQIDITGLDKPTLEDLPYGFTIAERDEDENEP